MLLHSYILVKVSAITHWEVLHMFTIAKWFLEYRHVINGNSTKTLLSQCPLQLNTAFSECLTCTLTQLAILPSQYPLQLNTTFSECLACTY